MTTLELFVSELQEFLIGFKEDNHNIIRRHSKKLEELGDLSFPLHAKNWFHLIQNCDTDHIFQHKFPNQDIQTQCEQLKLASNRWHMQIDKILIKKCDIHIFFNRCKYLFQEIIGKVIFNNTQYGSSAILSLKFNIRNSLSICDIENPNLTHLRILILENVIKKLLEFMSVDHEKMGVMDIVISINPVKNAKTVLCSPVLDEHGVKSYASAADLYQKRAAAMRMMAQHKYGVQVKGNTGWDEYFEKLGKGCVTMEMLSSKPQKPIKISLYDLQTAHKGAAFIFYNCARLAALFKEFDKRVASGLYPKLPDVGDVDFSLLNQPEEWELFYVYIVQFPTVVKNCIQDVEKGMLNPQNLVSFLANLSSVFSVYYRRIRILTDSREHLHAVLYARIYLLKALQIVFHNALNLLDIEPVKEM